MLSTQSAKNKKTCSQTSAILYTLNFPTCFIDVRLNLKNDSLATNASLHLVHTSFTWFLCGSKKSETMVLSQLTYPVPQHKLVSKYISPSNITSVSKKLQHPKNSLPKRFETDTMHRDRDEQNGFAFQFPISRQSSRDSSSGAKFEKIAPKLVFLFY